MRAIKDTKPAFQAVSIVLESQEDVDKMFAVFNFSPIARALQLEENPLEAYQDHGYDKFHVALMKEFQPDHPKKGK